MIALPIALFFAIVACLELGKRVGHRAMAADRLAHRGVGSLGAAVFALFGLLLGFAFAGAVARYYDRLQLAIREANAINTAYLRLDLLASDQLAARHLFRQYLDARIKVYQNIPQDVRTNRIAEAGELQKRIWRQAVEAWRADPAEHTGQIVLSAINEMIDVTTARTLALQTQTPTLLLVLLGIVALLSALLAGYSTSRRRRRSVPHALAYAACVAITVYTILDLDNPREGFIHLASAEKLLEDLRHSIHE